MKNIIIFGGDTGVAKNVVIELSKSLDTRIHIFLEPKVSAEFDLPNVKIHSFNLAEPEVYIDILEGLIKEIRVVHGLFLYSGITPLGCLITTSFELYVVKNMIDNGGGSIVYTGSSHMNYGEKNRLVYAASKGSVQLLMEHIARNYAVHNIRANTVVMGWTATKGELALRNELGLSHSMLKKQAEAVIPMGRMLSDSDPVPAILYFLSDDSCMVTGSIIRVTGGEFI
jgi:hypothetical protein